MEVEASVSVATEPLTKARSLLLYGHLWLVKGYIYSNNRWQLDESTARRQQKSPRSLSGRSIHLTLVTKWSWSWMSYCHPICAMPIGPHSEIQLFQNLTIKIHYQGHECGQRSMSRLRPSKFKGQGYGQGQTHWSYLRPGVQSICLLFVSWQSDHLWLRYRKFHIWPWKFKVKVMAKVKPHGNIWGLGVQSICLLFVSWQSDHFWLRYSKFYIWPWKFKVKVMANVKPYGHIWALECHR